jgi:hypothetical protein
MHADDNVGFRSCNQLFARGLVREVTEVGANAPASLDRYLPSCHQLIKRLRGKPSHVPHEEQFDWTDS